MTATTYEEFIQLIASEKATLAWIEPKQRLLLWTLDSGAIYKRAVPEYTVGLRVATTELTEVFTEVLNPGEFFFKYLTKELFVRLADDSNPQSSFMSARYRLFFSSYPANLTHDLLKTGNGVHYEGRLVGTPKFTFEVDNEDQFGVALESGGSLRLINNDGFFESIYDKYSFENARTRLYSWSPSLPIGEKKILFDGSVEDKDFKKASATFRIKDFVFKLKNRIQTNNFKLSDGTINDSVVGKPKRTIYGKVIGSKLQSMDQTFGGVTRAGTLSGTAGSSIITGAGTAFLADLSPDDSIVINIIGEDTQFSVADITSNTAAEVSEEFEASFNGKTFKVIYDRPPRDKNRTFSIAGHKLREPTTTIVRTVQRNRIEVVSTEDMAAADKVNIAAFTRIIKRIAPGNILILTQNMPTEQPAATVVSRNPVNAIYFLSRELLIDRDWTVDNGAEAKLLFNDLAEFNVAPVKKLVGVITFTNGSRNVTGAGSDFATLLPRDWVRSTDINHQVWYEVLKINGPGDLDVRIAYAGVNTAGDATRKNVDLIGDDSIVSADVFGKEDANGKWIKTASDAIQDMLEDAGFETGNLLQSSFDDAKAEAPYILSLQLPLNPLSNPPRIRTVVNLINKSVFGSLVVRNDFTVAYDVLSPHRNDLLEVKDDDILGWTVQSRTEIFRKFDGHYQHFDVDRFSEQIGFKLVEPVSSFVDNLIGTADEEGEDLYLFETQDAQTIAERYLLHHSLSSAVVKIKTKMNLTLKNINDKLLLTLDDIYQRFGESANKRKVGIISKISRSGESTDLEVSDLGNTFSRVGAIATDTSVDFSTSTELDRMANGYVVDDVLEVPDVASEAEIGSNVIG